MALTAQWPGGPTASSAATHSCSGAAVRRRKREGGRLDVARKGWRVLMRCRGSDDAEAGQAWRRARGDAVPDEDDSDAAMDPMGDGKR